MIEANISMDQTAVPLMAAYRRLPVAFTHGEGVWLFDTKEKKYFDAISGVGVCNLGHRHPVVTQAICDQAQRLIHISNLYLNPLQQKLASELTQLSGMDNCFFCNSGAEANEAAIKLARLYGHQKSISIPQIIVMENAFHGRTLATLSATGNRKVQAGFEPLVQGFVRAPLNNFEALQHIAQNNPNVVALMIEPIQGEGGINVIQEGYLEQLRSLCDEYQWLLIVDEIQTGNGRTGKYFAYQHDNIIPDVVTTAKALGNGFPIGACLATGTAANLLHPGSHGSTQGGNPLACAAALSVVATLFDENLIDNATKKGNFILTELKKYLIGTEYTIAVRGKGLMIGIELNQPCKELVDLALAKGLLINVTAERVVRLLPPLIISQEQAEWLVETLCKLIKAYMGDDRRKPRK